MKIGVDVDGVIINSDESIRVHAELFDLFNSKDKGIQVKEGIVLAEEMYDWSEEERKEFITKRLHEAIYNAPYVPGAIKILKKLKEDGHELILITARGTLIPELKEETEQRIKESGLEFTKKYYKQNRKVDIALAEDIDVMIDDRASICKAMSDNKIHGLYLRDINRPIFEENEYFHEVNNWGEIYRFIYNLNRKENRNE